MEGSYSSCVSTDILLKLVRLCETTHLLDEQVDSLAQMAEGQVTTVDTLNERLDANLKALSYAVKSQQEGSAKLLQNSETVMAWLSREREIADLFSKSSKEIQAVWTEVKGIGPSISTMLDSLASITDLFGLLHILSINTAIEASKYGEKGRSFSIIAREMRSLADRSRTFTDAIQNQARYVHEQIQDLMKKLTSSMESYMKLEKTVQDFLADSRNIRDNTQDVLELVRHYGELSTHQVQEWEHSLELLRGLEQIADDLLGRSRQIETITDRLFEMIQDETEDISHGRTELHERALSEARLIAGEIDRKHLSDRSWIDTVLSRHSEGSDIFELLYVLDETGRQVSCNVYAPRYREFHDPREGYSVLRSQKEYYRIPISSRIEYFSPVYLSSATRALCITVAIPLIEGDQIYGLLCADVDLRRLADQLAD